MNLKRYYMFIGDCPLEDMGKKSIRFVIESENGIVSNTVELKGAIVARNKGARRMLGEHSTHWANPIVDMLSGYAPSCIPVTAEYVAENFDFVGGSVVEEMNRIDKKWHDHAWRDSSNPPAYAPKEAKGIVCPSF